MGVTILRASEIVTSIYLCFRGGSSIMTDRVILV